MGEIPEDGLPLPFRHLHPEPLRKAPASGMPAPGRKLKAGAARSWMAELLFEQSIVAEPSAGVADTGAGGGAGSGMTRGQLLDGFVGEEPPRTFAEYRALLSALFDPKRESLVQALLKEPVFGSAQRAWSPKQSTGNANIARELVPFVVKGMERVYDFAAPPVEFVAAAGFLGTYDMKHHKISLTPALFGQPLKEFLDTLVHEEIHALQAELLLMLNTRMRGKVLQPGERAIARYWKNEEPRYRSALAAGSQMSPETKRRYRMIGQEYHAWTTGHYVGTKLTGPSGPARNQP